MTPFLLTCLPSSLLSTSTSRISLASFSSIAIAFSRLSVRLGATRKSDGAKKGGAWCETVLRFFYSFSCVIIFRTIAQLTERLKRLPELGNHRRSSQYKWNSNIDIVLSNYKMKLKVSKIDCIVCQRGQVSKKNCGAASVGVLQDNLVLSTGWPP